MANTNYIVPFLLLAFAHSVIAHKSGFFPTATEILLMTEENCFVAISSISTVSESEDTDALKDGLTKIYFMEDHVIIGQINIDGFLWPDKTKPKVFKHKNGKSNAKRMFVFQKQIKDRSCLHKAPQPKPAIVEFENLEDYKLENIIQFINEHCFAFRTIDGNLSSDGRHRKDILSNLFHVQSISDVNMRKISEKQQSLSTCTHQTDTCSSIGVHNFFYQSQIPQCEKTTMTDFSHFFHEHLKASKPVIIKDAMMRWKTHRWTEKFLRQKYGNEDVHIKLTPAGEYEGVEAASLWENFDSFYSKIPFEVKQQLKFPDLVVVRPATLNMKFSQFLDLVNLISNGTLKDVSAYLEYSSIREYFPELENDISEMEFVGGLLNLKHLNIWLSDGNTLGKTHFDPFDNFLCQISGRKEVILFDPHDNEKLYEAHIPEATLSYKKEENRFYRKELLESTSLVMSPVDILNPNFERFSKFAEAFPMNCTIDEGDVLFIPAFWWHEVQSHPSKTEGRNLAVNYWYEPFLTKEFPCEDCRLDVNPKYSHLL